MSKKLKLAVFGHYDSRGGTSAIIVDGFSMADREPAFRKYEEMFGWTPETGVTQAGVGREVDQLMHKLVYGDGSPANEDFLFMAELEMPDDCICDGCGGKLEDHFGEGVDLETHGVVMSHDPAIREGNIEPVENVVKLKFIPITGGRDSDEAQDDDGEWKHPEVVAHLRDGWDIPNWNDDAFGFIVQR